MREECIPGTGNSMYKAPEAGDQGLFLFLRLHSWDHSLVLGSAQHPRFFQCALKVEHHLMKTL